MFEYQTSVKLHQTDAAGLLFFGHQFTICHDTYELFMESIRADFATLFKAKDYQLAIAHAESDFKKPLYVGDRLRVELTVARAGESSYTINYRLFDPSGTLAGTASTVHVCVDKETQKSRPLPEDLKKELQKHLQAPD